MRDSDPRRRSGGHPGEAKPGNEPLDQGLHRMLGGAPAEDAEGDAATPATAEADAPAATDTPASDDVKDAPKPRRARRKPAAEKAVDEAKADDKKKEEPVADAAE